MTAERNDPLRDLINGTLAFYERFDLPRDRDGAVRNFHEEATELIEAARENVDKGHIAEEAADVFVTAVGVCWAHGIDPETLIDQVYAVIAKNDAKTHDTHHLIDGKITRRNKKGSKSDV